MPAYRYEAADAAIARALPELPGGVLHVFNKADAGSESVATALASQPDALALSARTGEGLDALRRELLARAG